MAIAVVMDMPGATLDQYDEVSRRHNFEPGGGGPDGMLFHWCAATDTGFRVTDVWETQEQYEAFAAVIGPSIEEVGPPNPPVVQILPVHSYLTASVGALH